MENDLTGIGDAPYGKDPALGESGFDGPSGSFFDKEAVCRVIETEDPWDVHVGDRHLWERTAFFTVFLLTGFVGGIVGRGHGDGLNRPRMGFEPARAFVQVAVESDDRSRFAESGDGTASGEKLRYGDVGVFRIGVRVFEFVYEGSRDGYRARSRERFVAVLGLSEIVSGDFRENRKSGGLVRSDGFHGDERSGGRNLGRNVYPASRFRLEIE